MAIPTLLGVACLVVSGLAAPIVAWLLMIAAFGLLFDAGLAMMPTTGGLHSHRQ